MSKSVLKLGLSAVMGLLLAACGGDGGGSSASSSASSGGSNSSGSSASTSSGASSSASSAASSSAASAAAVVSGTITGFGSVHVNGIHFETEHAAITKDDLPITQQALRVGQVVRIKGRVDDGTGTGVADSIEFSNNVEGFITSISLANNSFVVLGQTVMVDADTSFDDSMPVAALSGLRVGDRVEVSGLVNAAGEILAGRIELGSVTASASSSTSSAASSSANSAASSSAGSASSEASSSASSGISSSASSSSVGGVAGARVELMGKVAAVNATTHSFMIGAQLIDYSAATLEDFGARVPADGDTVEVHGTLSAGNVLLATRVELKGADERAANADHEIEGLVTRYVSVTSFDVAGKPVTTTSATRFVNGTAANLALNVRLEVEGVVNSAGVLVADKVEFRVTSSLRIRARVESVDAANKQLTILGVVIRTSAVTRFEDKSAQDVELFSLANVVAGDYVEVRVGLSGGVLTATRVEREQPRTEVELRATVSAVNAPQFTAQGIVVATNSATRFEDGSSNAIAAAQFFTLANGLSVKVIGTLSGTIFTATRVEFSGSED